MASYAQNSTLGAAEPARETTLLEAHLQELQKLNDSLEGACERGERCADRLSGPQPQPVAKGEASSNAPPLPLLRRLEVAVMRAHDLASGVHRQMERFERL